MLWQPTETAPRDGTYILLYAKGYYAIATWMECSLDTEPGKRWVISTVDCMGEPHGQDIVLNPTHWMPLPEPPKD